MILFFQGSYVPEHEGKSKVFPSDSHFLFSGICCDCILIDLNWCINLILFIFYFFPKHITSIVCFFSCWLNYSLFRFQYNDNKRFYWFCTWYICRVRFMEFFRLGKCWMLRSFNSSWNDIYLYHIWSQEMSIYKIFWEIICWKSSYISCVNKRKKQLYF